MRRKSLSTLRREAASGTAWRGHRMRWQQISPTLVRGVCIRCGLDVDCDTHPPANGIDIGGPAVALNCSTTTGNA